MPISAYFDGHGKKVMADMKKKNGEEAGEREFYATANQQDQNPKRKRSFVARAIEQERA